MAARESQMMVNARRYVMRGKNANQAALLSGVSRQAIYMSKWYREYIDAQKTAKLSGTTIRRSS